MNAIELYHSNGKPCGIYHCEKCSVVHRTKQLADECCLPRVCDCGAECPQPYTVCDECRRKKDIARERSRFDAAEKVKEWSGPVCAPHSDRYGRNLDELLELLDYDESDPPEYVWTCSERPVCHLDYGSIIEGATSDAYEDFDPDSLHGEKELTEALEKFNALNKENVVWEPNYKVALVLEAAGRAAADGSADETGEAKSGAGSASDGTEERREPRPTET
jgi:hypothetical protein